MKKLLLASVALFGFAGAAAAADLPIRAAPPAPIIIPIFTWTGFYVGVNAGGAWSNNNDHNNGFVPGVGFVGRGNNNNNGGFTGGGQIGYNYQVGGWVIGLETDIQFADIGRRNNDDFLFVTHPELFGLNRGSNNNFFGTVRARAGYAFDRTLLYITGGFAYGEIGRNDIFGGGSSNGGWTLGGGVEYAFTNNFTARLEGLFVSLERNRNNDFRFLVPADEFGFNHRRNGEFGVVRAAVNYKFGTY